MRSSFQNAFHLTLYYWFPILGNHSPILDTHGFLYVLFVNFISKQHMDVIPAALSSCTNKVPRKQKFRKKRYFVIPVKIVKRYWRHSKMFPKSSLKISSSKAYIFDERDIATLCDYGLFCKLKNSVFLALFRYLVFRATRKFLLVTEREFSAC